MGCVRNRRSFAGICSFVGPVSPSGGTTGSAHCGVLFCECLQTCQKPCYWPLSSFIVHNTSVIFAKKEVSSHQLSSRYACATRSLERGGSRHAACWEEPQADGTRKAAGRSIFHNLMCVCYLYRNLMFGIFVTLYFSLV